MLPPPPIRGLFRTDHRARAAYAEGAGIFRILPAAVCVPRDREDRRLAGALGVRAPRGAGAAGRGQRHGRRQRGRRRRRRPHRRCRPGVRRRRPARAGRGPAPASRWPTSTGPRDRRGPPAAARSLERALGHARRHAVHQRRGRADRPLRQRAPLGRERRARDGRRRGDRAPPRPAPGRPHARGRAVRGRGRARHPRGGRAGSRAVPAHPEERLGLRARRLARVRRPARSRDRRRRHARHRHLGGVAARSGARRARGPPGRACARSTPSPTRWSPCWCTQPSAVELLDRTFLELVGEAGPEAVLLVEIERDDPAAAREAVERAAAAVAPWAASVDPGFTAAAAERLWALRHAASPILAGLPESRRSLQVIEDGCVPVERMGEYVRAVREAAAERGLAVVIFGHAGDGHVHVNLLPEIGAAGLGGVGGVAARGGHRRARPARRHAVGRARRRPAPRRTARRASTATRSWRCSPG